MNNALVRLIGWKAMVLHGDPCLFDRYRWLKRHLQPGSLRTLDAGSGSGALAIYAARIGNQTLGISFDKRANQKARGRANLLRLPNVEFMDGDLRDLRLMDQLGGFDQIVCLETIEHIRNDEQLVADLSRLLKPGGRLFLTTPFKHYKHLLGDRLSESEDGGHVRWGYTHGELRDLFGPAGLAVETQDYLSGVVAQQITNLYRLLGSLNLKIAWALTFPLRAFQVFDRPLTRLIGYPYLAVGVVGVKTRQPRCPEDSQPQFHVSIAEGFDQGGTADACGT